MSEPAIQFERNPAERFRLPVRLPLACCCSCCCCVHSVGGIVGAIVASRPPAGVSVPTPRHVTAPVPAEKPVDEPTQRVLSLYLVFRAADMACRKGRLPVARFEAVVEALAGRADAVWESMFRGREPEALAWVLERLHMLASEGAMPKEAMQALRAHLTPRAAGAGSERIRGAMASLWCLAALHRECAAAVARGELAAEALPRLRDAIHRRTDALLAPVEGAGADRGLFSGQVAQLATDLVTELTGRAQLLPEDGLVLTAEVSLLASGVASEAGAGFDASQLPDSAACEVCGDGLKGWPSVLCAACETPHHADCWDYNARCATFACGALDFIGPGGKPPSKVRFDLAGKQAASEKLPVRALDFDEARVGGVTRFWAFFFGVIIFYPVLFPRESPIMLAIFLPAVQLLASLLAALSIAFFGKEGRRRPAIFQLGKIVLYTILGSLLGGVIFPGTCMIFR